MWLFLSLLTSIPHNMCSPQMWQAFIEQAENPDSINWQEIRDKDSTLSCLLQNAIAEKNVQLAELLLQNGADADIKNERGQTILYGEVNKANNLEIIKLLVRYGADINAIDNYGIPVISRAVLSRDINIIRFMIDNGADIESAESPDKGSQYNPIDLLYYPIIEGRLDIVKLLLENGAKVSLEDRPGNVLSTTVARGNLHMAQFLIEYGIDVNARSHGGKTALFFSKTRRMTQFLIDNGAEVNAKDDDFIITPLFEAAQWQNAAWATTLISNGAEVNVRDDDGKTPLFNASTIEIAQLLIDHGADLNVKDRYGLKPLYMAIRNKRNDVAKFLIDNGADIKAKTNENRATLYQASTKELAKLLIDGGADINAKDISGHTALFYATSRGNIDLMQFLIDNGAKLNARDFSHPNPFKNPLAKAIGLRNIAAIKLLVANGADVDTTTRRADNPLMLAIIEQDREIIQLLLDLGADPWYLEPENIKGYLLSQPTFFRTDIPIFLRSNQFRI